MGNRRGVITIVIIGFILLGVSIVLAQSMSWTFTTPSNYIYNSSEINVTGGVAKLVSTAPDNITFYANFNSGFDATYGRGDLTGDNNGASITGGALDCRGGTAKYVDYNATLNADSEQKGAIRFLFIPNYTGNPATTRVMVSLAEGDGSATSALQIQQQNNGNLRFVVFNASDDAMVLQDTPYGFTKDQVYEIEFNWDLDTGANRIFVDGNQQGGTETTSGTRGSATELLRVGTNYAGTGAGDFRIDNLTLFRDVQHTSGYTPLAAIPESVITHSSIYPKTPFEYFVSLNAFSETATKPAVSDVHYQISSNNGTTWEWWNTTDWEVIISAGDFAIGTGVENITGPVTSGNLASIQALDANVYEVDEIVGVPALEVDVDFDGTLSDVDQVSVYGWYDGNPAHNMDVSIYNFSSSAWVKLGEIPNSGAQVVTEYNFSVTGTLSDYRDESGNVDIQLEHAQSGSNGHYLGIDYITLRLVDPSDEWYYDNEANGISTISSNIATFDSSGNFTFRAFLGFNGIDIVELSNIIVSSTVVFPVISDVGAINLDYNYADIEWDTDVSSNSSVIYGLSADNLNLSAGSSSAVTYHVIPLSGLSESTTYFYNVTSCTGSGCNSTGTFNFTTLTNPIDPSTIVGVIVGENLIFKQNQVLDFKGLCIASDSSTGYCTSETDCTVTIFDPTGQVIVSGGVMTHNTEYYNYTLNASQSSVIGTYQGTLLCIGDNQEQTSFTYQVTPSGQNIPLGSVFVYLFSLLVVLTITFLSIRLIAKNPIEKDTLCNQALYDMKKQNEFTYYLNVLKRKMWIVGVFGVYLSVLAFSALLNQVVYNIGLSQLSGLLNYTIILLTWGLIPFTLFWFSYIIIYLYKATEEIMRHQFGGLKR